MSGMESLWVWLFFLASNSLLPPFALMQKVEPKNQDQPKPLRVSDRPPAVTPRLLWAFATIGRSFGTYQGKRFLWAANVTHVLLVGETAGAGVFCQLATAFKAQRAYGRKQGAGSPKGNGGMADLRMADVGFGVWDLGIWFFFWDWGFNF